MLPAPASANVQRIRVHLDSNGNSNSNNSSNNTTRTTATSAQRQQLVQHQQLVLPPPPPPTPTPHHQLQQHLQQLQQHRTNKRSASMIFRIEHLLPGAATCGAPPTPLCSSAATTTLATCHTALHATTAASNGTTTAAAAAAATSKRAKQRVLRSGVYMAQFTPKDTISEALPTFMLMNSSSNNSNSSSAAGGRGSLEPPAAACCTIAQGVLRMSPPLLRRIKLSEDIHSYNALFELQGSSVRVRVVRDIARDEELVAWFGEQTSLLMALPFLTPLNIQGNKRYTCHLCHLTFETPNPLKIHLALGCGRHSMDILWIRLHYALKANAYTQQQQLLQQQQEPPPLQQQLLQQRARMCPTPPITQQQHSPAPPNSSTSSISPVTSPLPPTTSAAQQHPPSTSIHALPPRFSAFKPVSPSIVYTSAATSCTTTGGHSLAALHTSNALTCNAPLPFLPPLSVAGSSLSHLGLLQPAAVGVGVNPLNAAAQIEAIVSNMGASKQGHLCIYCGKVYSRKYGLKIHIRTHTGFKPLKCKFCLRPFGDPSNLNKHVRLHLQTSASTATIEGYKCALCNKTLARRRDLQRHMESRHAEGATIATTTTTATATATTTT